MNAAPTELIMTKRKTTNRKSATPSPPAAPKPAPASVLAPAPEPPPTASSPAPGGKLGAMVALLSRPEGATIAAMVLATGWQAHSVRGAMAGALKKRGLTVTSEKIDGLRTYRLPAPLVAETLPVDEVQP